MCILTVNGECMLGREVVAVEAALEAAEAEGNVTDFDARVRVVAAVRSVAARSIQRLVRPVIAAEREARMRLGAAVAVQAWTRERQQRRRWRGLQNSIGRMMSRAQEHSADAMRREHDRCDLERPLRHSHEVAEPERALHRQGVRARVLRAIPRHGAVRGDQTPAVLVGQGGPTRCNDHSGGGGGHHDGQACRQPG